MNRFCFVFLLFLLPNGSFGQLEKVFIEIYYISDEIDSTDLTGGKLDSGSVTYRVYVDLKPGSVLKRIYGGENHPLSFSSTEVFFNNVDGQTFGKDFLKSRYSENTIALDTWITLGQTTKVQGNKAYFGIPKNQDTDGSFIGGINNDGGSEVIAQGLLTNNDPAMNEQLTIADGMDTLMQFPSSWTDFGFKDVASGNDSTVLGSLVEGTSFTSTNCWLENSGSKGVDADSNQLLIAQFTTKGELSFAFNLEVEYLVDNVLTTINYVADNAVLNDGEEFSPYLKYPFTCGCTDPNFLEYDENYACYEPGSCIHPIIYGCMDTLACNFDPTANFSIHSLCCFPGACANRDIAEVCPGLMGDNFSFEIYPNPAEGILNLHILTGVIQDVTYLIYNPFGVLLSEKTISGSQLNISEEIDISGLNNGLYHLHVVTDSQMRTELFIKK